ncbi:tetratricopeptide repeat protein [Fibrella sp. HMF5335]|uniref:Tetratricopeptide repeat protein n=1 Tax=Fibrella rubiginis TaxID=2817060 RepID=A0A939GD24_9BACT|nr:tetratricopeptide repeat protein [Fibrella rubiginis]MBO0935300.1 tetratricopeptide repeat protein [Fibrella rubiginis]
MIYSNYLPSIFRAYLGSVLFSVEYDFILSETHLKAAFRQEDKNLTFILLLCQLYQKKLEYSEAQTNLISTESALSTYAQLGINVVKEKPEPLWNDVDYRFLAEFQLMMARYDDAVASFNKALILNPDFFDARVGLGIAKQKLANWSEAHVAFKHAIRLDPNDLNARCSLAEVLINLERFADAEQELKRVKQIAPNHVDMLIWMGKLFTWLGDEAYKKEEYDHACQRFSHAISSFEKISTGQKNSDYSRRITPDERDTINYFIGYCRVKLCQTQVKPGAILQRLVKGPKNLLMSSIEEEVDNAKNNFSQIKEYSRNYFEAQQSIRRLDKFLKERNQFTNIQPSRVAGYTVATITLAVFLFAQYLFVMGTMFWPKSYYTIKPNQVLIDGALLKLDSAHKNSLTDNVANLVKIQYPSRDSLIREWQQKVEPKLPINSDWIERIDQNQQITLSEGTYMSITFISIFFIIAGLILPELTKLKVGSIELEKAKLETATSTPSLSVSAGPTTGPTALRS